jgi:predicted N-formylglutamate amidohydrolase
MGLPAADYLILSCEHGGNRLPAPYRGLFAEQFLSTHRGYDPGALAVARDFAALTGSPLFYSTVSRLLVELNRPPGHPHIFFKAFPEETRDALLRRYYLPYWSSVETAVRNAVRRRRRVLHISVHSFTPRFRGARRTTDLGLLFDPLRRREAAFCAAWRARLEEQAPGMAVRYNDPYDGIHPSVVQSMREAFPQRSYVGIQIEVNQKFPRGDARRWLAVRRLLRTTLREPLSEW